MRSTSKAASAFWQPHLEAQQISGLSGKTYCLKHDLNYHRFCYHKRKRRSASGDTGSPSGNGFVRVSVTQPPSSSSGLSVTLPNGIRISGLDNESPEACAALIRALL